jgi:hypothetical protein
MVQILTTRRRPRRSVASAVNDTTREVGGVVGIAVLSSTLIATYRADLTPALDGLPAGLREPAADGIGSALGIADALGPGGPALADAARAAFTAGFSSALWVAAAILAVSATVCAALAPAHRPGDTPPDTNAPFPTPPVIATSTPPTEGGR